MQALTHYIVSRAPVLELFFPILSVDSSCFSNEVSHGNDILMSIDDMYSSLH